MAEKNGNDSNKERSVELEYPHVVADPAMTVIPPEIPLLPLDGECIFPSTITPLLIESKKYVQLIEDCFSGDRILGCVAQQSSDEESQSDQALYTRGTVGRILKTLKTPEGHLKILIQGLKRFEIETVVQQKPYLCIRATLLDDVVLPSPELEVLQASVSSLLTRLVSHSPTLPDEIRDLATSIKNPSHLTDLIASVLTIPFAEKQELVETLEVRSRLEKLSAILGREVELLKLNHKIQMQAQKDMNAHQKEAYLRQQLQAIQKELGEEDAQTGEKESLKEKIEQSGMSAEARKVADAEFKRFQTIPPQSPEHAMVRTYLEWLVELPWMAATTDNLDILHAQQVLDAEHAGLEKVKDRILEHIAVRKLRDNPRGPILCFVGPPGVGKTSLGRSIAHALGRQFMRLALGGVRDESEIRGHRRTYIGALPGRILQALSTAGSNNPVIMLDEVDKLGQDFRGDPASALLEVLDPEQNHTFSDHYLGVPFDLSRVMFITTANALDPIPAALRDRMEIIQLSGYTEEEKVEIAEQHLIPKQIAEHGLIAEQLSWTTEAVASLTRSYTREAGVRNLEREIGCICRKIARRITEGYTETTEVTPAKIVEFLGPEKFMTEMVEAEQEPGVVTGLAWTPQGGDVLTVESVRMPGKKGLTLTGHLGDVMKESAQTALSLIRSRADQLGIPADFFETSDVHIHVPAGAIPKDGPSAGITLATALASLLTQRPLTPHLAMTGEISLRGKVLPVGGIKEKVLAAQRAGIQTVILPVRNEKDLADVPQSARDSMTFHWVNTIDEVLDIALAPHLVSVDTVPTATPTTGFERAAA